MKDICDEWHREMQEMRLERRLLITAILALLGIKLYL